MFRMSTTPAKASPPVGVRKATERLTPEKPLTGIGAPHVSADLTSSGVRRGSPAFVCRPAILHAPHSLGERHSLPCPFGRGAIDSHLGHFPKSWVGSYR